MEKRRRFALLGGRTLRYEVRKHRQARSATARVNRRDGVVVTLPWRVPFRVVPSLLKEWEPFLVEQAEKYGVWNGPAVREFSTGSELWILGELRSLQIEALPAQRKRYSAALEPGALRLALAPEEILDVRPAVEKFLRRLARTELVDRVKHWAPRVGREPTKVMIGERTSRWGSCSRRGTLSFCYRLVMAPPETIDAVVAHELCHLVHLNHSPRFYELLDEVCPGHRQVMAWLDVHHDELLI